MNNRAMKRFFGGKQNKTPQPGHKTYPPVSSEDQHHRRDSSSGGDKDGARTAAGSGVGGSKESGAKKGILRMTNRRKTRPPSHPVTLDALHDHGQQRRHTSRERDAADHRRVPRGGDHEATRLQHNSKTNPISMAAGGYDHTPPGPPAGPPPPTPLGPDGASTISPLPPPSILHKQSHFTGNWHGPQAGHSPRFSPHDAGSPPSADSSIQSLSSCAMIPGSNTRVRFMSSSSILSSASDTGVHLMAGGASGSVSMASSDYTGSRDNVFDRVLHVVMAEEEAERNRLNAMGMQYGMDSDYGEGDFVATSCTGGETSPLSPATSEDSLEHRALLEKLQHPLVESPADEDYHDANDDQLDETKWNTLQDAATSAIDKLDLDGGAGENHSAVRGHANTDHHRIHPMDAKKASPDKTSAHDAPKLPPREDGVGDLFASSGFPPFGEEHNERKTEAVPAWAKGWQQMGGNTNSQPISGKESTVIQHAEHKKHSPTKPTGWDISGKESTVIQHVKQQKQSPTKPAGWNFPEKPTPDDWVSFDANKQSPKKHDALAFF